MDKNKKTTLDEGFEEVPLDEGFQSIPINSTKNDPTKMDTFIGSSLQGSTLGFGDELTAGIAAGLGVLESPEKNKLNQYKNLYKKYLDEERNQLKLESEANPTTALVGNLAGGVLTAAVPGASAFNSLKGASGLGAVTGYGLSEAKNLPETVLDVAEGAAGGAIIQKSLPVLAKTPSLIKKSVNVTDELLEKTPILGKGYSALKGSLKGKKYLNNEEEYANQLLKQAEELVESTRSLSESVFKNKRKLLEDVKKTGKVADLQQFYDDSIKELENIPGKLTEGFEDKRQTILKEYNKRRFGDKELIPEQVIESKGDYTELISNRPELEKQLEKEIIKGKTLGERITSQIDEVTSPTNEKYLVGKLIKDKDASPENVRILKAFDFTKKEEAERLLQNELLKAKALGEDVVGDLQEVIADSGEKILLPKIIKKSELGTAKDISVLKPIEAVTKTPRTDVTKVIKPPYEKIKDLPKTIQNPSQIEDLIKETRAILDDPNSTQFYSFARQRLKELQKIQNEMVPGLEQANKESSSAMQLFNYLTGKNVQDLVPGFNESDLLKLETGLAKNVLEKQITDPYKRIEMQKLLEGFKKIKGVKDISPETASNISNILEKSKQSAKDLNLAQIVSEDTTPYIQSGLEKASILAGESLGKITRRASQGTLGIVKNVTPEFMQDLALKASNKFGEAGKRMANILAASENKSQQARTAIMFSLMQNPEYRQMIEALNPIELEE